MICKTRRQEDKKIILQEDNSNKYMLQSTVS